MQVQSHSTARKAHNTSDIFFINESYSTHQHKPVIKNNLTKSQIFSSNEDPSVKEVRKQPNHYRTQSSIILGDDDNRTEAPKRPKYSNSEYNPNLYYKQESAYNRKVKQFYDGDKYSELLRSQTSSLGVLKKENFTHYQEQKVDNNPNKQINAKERKLRDIYSHDKLVQTLTNSEKKLTEKTQSSPFKDPKFNLVENLKSNIFNDPDKEKLNQTLPSNFKQKTEPKTEVKKKKTPLNPWNANLDWKTANNELLFKNEYKQHNLTAKERLLNDIKGNLSQHPEIYNTENVKRKLDEKNSVENVFKENLGNNEAKIRKNMNLVSHMEPKEFYESSLKMSQTPLEKNAISLEIKNVNDIENTKEIQRLYRKQGVHIFDIKTNGSYVNGNINGVISFKIRDNGENMKDKLEEVKGKLKSEMGLEVQEKKEKAKNNPKFNLTLPADMGWDSVHLSKLVKNSEEKSNKVMTVKRLNSKFSSEYQTVNHQYKSNSKH